MVLGNLSKACLQLDRSKPGGLCRLMISWRCLYSTAATQAAPPASEPAAAPSIRAQVYMLQGKNIFENLAMEEWMLHNLETKTKYALLLYRNGPTVVIGRMQNPFKEVDLHHVLGDKTSDGESIELARRRSGGGTVYHDHGNINYSFVQSRDDLDKGMNASIVRDALRRQFKAPSTINKRGDVLVDERKISGCAQRITGKRSYHHGTLLIDSKLSDLWKAISSPLNNKLYGKGTNSVRSPVCNLVEYAPKAQVDQVLKAIADEFLYVRTNPLFAHAECQMDLDHPTPLLEDPKFHDTVCALYPANYTDESAFLGSKPVDNALPWFEVSVQDVDQVFLQREMEELVSSKWRYGATFGFNHPISVELLTGKFSIELEIGRGAQYIEAVKDCVVKDLFGEPDPYAKEMIAKAWHGAPYSGSSMVKAIRDLQQSTRYVPSPRLDEICTYVREHIPDIQW